MTDTDWPASWVSLEDATDRQIVRWLDEPLSPRLRRPLEVEDGASGRTLTM